MVNNSKNFAVPIYLLTTLIQLCTIKLMLTFQVFLDQMVDINPNHQMKGRNVSPIPGLQTFSV